MATGSQSGTHFQSESNATIICPKCATEYRAGTSVCQHCGRIFTRRDKTAQFNKPIIAADNKPATGSLIAKQWKPVFIEIGDQQIELPNQLVIVLGRSASDLTATQPDLALDQFGAAEKGVSRNHARITRYYNLLYVTDMGSCNGTFLNGQPLMNNNARILRTGDELLLGFLRLIIRF